METQDEIKSAIAEMLADVNSRRLKNGLNPLTEEELIIKILSKNLPD